MITAGRIVLALVFVIAAAAKLLDRSGAREGAVELGVQPRAAGPVATGVVITELGVAAALIPMSTSRIAAGVALGLLTGFSVALGLALIRGRRPDCHCFGPVSRPAGPAAVIRNVVLAAVATTILVGGPGASLTNWLDRLSPADTALTAACGVLAVGVSALVWLGWQMLRQQGRLLLRIEALESARQDGGARRPPVLGLPVGTPAPEVALGSLDGEVRLLSEYLMGAEWTALVFMHPGCGPCTALLPRLTAVAAGARVSAGRVLVIGQGDPDENAAMAGERGVEDLLLDPGGDVGRAFNVRGTPAVVVVDGEGIVTEPAASGGAAVAALLERLNDRVESAVTTVTARSDR